MWMFVKWSGMKWKKKDPMSYFHLLPFPSLTSVSFASLTLTLKINDEMTSF